MSQGWSTLYDIKLLSTYTGNGVGVGMGNDVEWKYDDWKAMGSAYGVYSRLLIKGVVTD